MNKEAALDAIKKITRDPLALDDLTVDGKRRMEVIMKSLNNMTERDRLTILKRLARRYEVERYKSSAVSRYGRAARKEKGRQS